MSDSRGYSVSRLRRIAEYNSVPHHSISHTASISHTRWLASPVRLRSLQYVDLCLHSWSTVVKSHPSEYCNRSGSFLGVGRPVCSKQIVDTLLSLCLVGRAWSASLALAARKLAYSSAKLGACLSLTIVERRRSCSEWWCRLKTTYVELAELPGVAESSPAACGEERSTGFQPGRNSSCRGHDEDRGIWQWWHHMRHAGGKVTRERHLGRERSS